MAMQIATLYTGHGAPPQVPLENRREKGPPLPMERETDTGQTEAVLPGSSRSGSADLQQTTADLEQISLAFDRRLKFVIDHDSRQITVKVIDNETDKVIKVLPPEELQRLHSRIRETIGNLFDRTI